MPEVFADTGYWRAMHDPDDDLHRKAREITDTLSGSRIVTSEMVIVEFLNSVARYGSAGRSQAVATVLALYRSSDEQVDIVPQTDAQLANAIARYASRPDQRWSLTDCASFLIMEQKGITEALAYDRDFVQAGFRALLRDT